MVNISRKDGNVVPQGVSWPSGALPKKLFDHSPHAVCFFFIKFSEKSSICLNFCRFSSNSMNCLEKVKTKSGRKQLVGLSTKKTDSKELTDGADLTLRPSVSTLS
jgi:hypothetical protein